MEIEWTSQRGKERFYNNDAVALGYKGRFLVAILVDAAENKKSIKAYSFRSPTKRFASFWADQCLQKILQLETIDSEEAIINVLSNQQKALRYDYLHDIASYGVLIVNIETGDLKWLYTGDCLFGLLANSGEVQWLNEPHRLNRLPLLLTQGVESQEISEHIITQSLNARRFKKPTLATSTIPVNTTTLATTSIIIGTDGYWSEHLQQGVAMSNTVDDVSFLTIKPGRKALKLNTDSPNLFVIYL